MLEGALQCEQSLCITQLNNSGLRMWTLKHGGGIRVKYVPLNDINAYEVEVYLLTYLLTYSMVQSPS